MISKYFRFKTRTERFKNDLNILVDEFKDKKVLLYGAGSGFVELDKRFNILKKFNVVAISDIKFTSQDKLFRGVKAITPAYILDEKPDIILVTNENSKQIVEYLTEELSISESYIRCIFEELVPVEKRMLTFLADNNFLNYFPRLVKKMEGKKVIVYGTGSVFMAIEKYFDLSKLNIIALCDREYYLDRKDENFPKYKTCTMDEIASLNPDYVLVATRFCVNIILDLYFDTLKNTKIKIIPFVKKTFINVVREIF